MGRVYAVRGVAPSLAISILVLAAVGVVVPLRSSAQRTGYVWSHEDSRDGIELYTSEAPGHSYDAVRAVAVVDARPEILVAILRDIATFPRWYSRCKQTRVLQRPQATLPIRLTPTEGSSRSRGRSRMCCTSCKACPW